MDFALEEFKTLREEIAVKNNRCYQILSFGFGGITIIFGFILQYGIYDLFFFLPLLILANSILYNSEKIAIIHAGSYIKKIENCIYRKCSAANRCNDDKIFGDMGWENNLKRSIYTPIMYAANTIFLIFYVMCVVEAWENSKSPLKNMFMILLAIWLVIGFVIIRKLFSEVPKKQSALSESS